MAGETLQDLVLHRLAELQRDRGRPLTLRQVARRSMGRVPEALLHAIVTGRGEMALSDRQLRGLAVALDLQLHHVYEVYLTGLAPDA